MKLTCLLILLTWPLFCHTGELVVSSSFPSGFEAFSERQTTLVDIYYDGEYKGELLLSYDLNRIWFEQADAFINMLDDALSKQELTAIVAAGLARNSQLVCQFPEQKDCGLIVPETIAVIFDESQFRLDAFVGSDYRLKPDFAKKRYLQASDPGFSSIHALQGVISGDRTGNSQDTSRSLYLNSMLNYDNHRLIGRYEYLDDQRRNLDRLSYHYETDAQEFELGYFQTQSALSNLVSTRNFSGLRWQTHLKRRSDLQQQRGSELLLFLNADSRVDVFRAGRLIASQFLAAGNQVLNTTEFPEGAYELDLEITDNRGNTRREQFFFAKSNRLPPLDEALYLFEAGRLDDRFSTLDAEGDLPLFVRFGSQFRLADSLGLGFGAISTEQQHFYHLGLDYYQADLNLRYEVGQSDENYWIQSGLFSFQWYNWLRFSAGLRRFSAGRVDYFGDLNEGITSQRIANLTMPIERGFINFNYQQQTVAGAKLLRQGLNLRYNLGFTDVGIWTFLLDWLKEEDSNTINLRFQFSLTGSATFANIESGYRYFEDLDSTANQSTTRLDISNRFWENSPLGVDTGVNAYRDQELTQYGIRGRLHSPKVFMDLATQRSMTDEQRQDNFTGTVNMNFVTTGEHVYMGGDRNQNSGVVVALNSEQVDSDSTFVVYVDNVPYKKMYNNSSVFVPLPAYKRFRIKLKQDGGAMLTFDSSEKVISLFPGHVKTLRYETAAIYVVVGQLIDEQGVPIANARIGLTQPAHFSDGAGWFQIERQSLAPIKIIKDQRTLCELNFAQSPIEGDIIWVEDKICSTPQ